MKVYLEHGEAYKTFIQQQTNRPIKEITEMFFQIMVVEVNEFIDVINSQQVHQMKKLNTTRVDYFSPKRIRELIRQVMPNMEEKLKVAEEDQKKVTIDVDWIRKREKKAGLK